jgi:lysozyme
MTDKLIDQLRRDEGEVLYAYKDTLGYWTIGVGILIDKEKGGGLLPEESEFILQNRVRKRREAVSKALPWFDKLDEARKGVLLNMSFQLGVDGLLGFRNTLEEVRKQNYAKAAERMLLSKWATQTPERAKRLAKQMITGEWC